MGGLVVCGRLGVHCVQFFHLGCGTGAAGWRIERLFTDSDREQVPDKCPPKKTNNAWTSITHDIARSSLYLHEVVLDPEESPRNLLHALADGPLGTVGIAAMCAVDASGHADTWLSVIEAASKHAFERDDLDTLVIVIDPTAIPDVMGALVGSVEPEIGPDGEVLGGLDGLLQPGPLVPRFPGMDLTPKVMGAWLADLFGELRRLGEETGIRVVVVRETSSVVPVLRRAFVQERAIPSRGTHVGSSPLGGTSNSACVKERQGKGRGPRAKQRQVGQRRCEGLRPHHLGASQLGHEGEVDAGRGRSPLHKRAFSVFSPRRALADGRESPVSAVRTDRSPAPRFDSHAAMAMAKFPEASPRVALLAA